MKNVFKHLIYGKNKKIKESQILYCSENMPQRAINEIMLKATFNGTLGNNEIYKFFPLEGLDEYVLVKTTFISGKDKGYVDDRYQTITHAIIFRSNEAEMLIDNIELIATKVGFASDYDDVERIEECNKNIISWEDLFKNTDEETSENYEEESIDYETLKLILSSLIENRQLLMAHNHVSSLNGIFNGVPRSIAKRMSLTFFANTAEEANGFKLIIFTDKAFEKLRMSMFMGMEVNPIVYGEKPTLEDKTVDIVNKYLKIFDDDPDRLEKLAQECSSTSEFFSKILDEYQNEEINNKDEDNRVFMEELEREIEKYNKKKNKVLAKRFINKVVFSLLLVVTIAFIASSSEISLHKAVLNISINASFVSGVILGFLVSSLKNLLGKDGRKK
ncbi:hypothetical protein [uncultured Eubacterium sp.]|uniref:hypothetical protein n=1 Tax=uncultured Eubacterium sp. TaxID=165185 RepID=UPI002595AE7F|nr:hypothetical protein [uncultured Eubacterium sp.]